MNEHEEWRQLNMENKNYNGAQRNVTVPESQTYRYLGHRVNYHSLGHPPPKNQPLAAV